MVRTVKADKFHHSKSPNICISFGAVLLYGKKNPLPTIYREYSVFIICLTVKTASLFCGCGPFKISDVLSFHLSPSLFASLSPVTSLHPLSALLVFLWKERSFLHTHSATSHHFSVNPEECRKGNQSSLFSRCVL